ncbi:MAG: glycosyltransferase family 2 protein [Lentisphaeria bacterium]
MSKISAYMITFNNEKTVEEALKSLHWADEIIVVDSFSSDNTVRIAQKYATVFKQHEFLGFQKQYQSAASLCSHKWRFFLDADEVVSPAMAIDIKAKITQQETSDNPIFGFYGKRRNYFIGRLIKWGGWRSDRELRLYHSDHGDWTEGLHSCLKVKSKTDFLNDYIVHYPYDNISAQIKTIDKYSDIACQDAINAQKSVNILKMLLNPFWRFFRDYFFKLGFLDGMPGLIIAWNSSFYLFCKQAKLYEIQKLKQKNKDL